MSGVEGLALALPLAAVQQVMLAGARIAAFLVLAPPFAHRGIPGTVKAMLAVGLALAVAPRLPAAVELGTAAFLGRLLVQVVVGAGMGVVVLAAVAAVQAAGDLVDVFGGFQLAAGFDPMAMTSGAQFSRLYQLTAVVLLFVTGAHQLLLGGVARSFDALPTDAGPDLGALASTLVEGSGQLLVAALQIAGPLLVVLVLADVALGLLTRVAPALNAFALGFPLKILLTLTLAGTAYLVLPDVVAGLAERALDGLAEVTR